MRKQRSCLDTVLFVVVGLVLVGAVWSAVRSCSLFKPRLTQGSTSHWVTQSPPQTAVEAATATVRIVTPTSTLTLPPPSATPEPTRTIRPTSTPKPTLDVTATPSATYTPTLAPSRATATPEALLPGLQPADIKVNLEQRDFSCSSAEEGELYFSWTCRREDSDYGMLVVFYGRTLNSVDLLESSIFQYGEPSDELAAAFLGYMATMPYDGVDPDAARAWVEDTLPTIAGQGDGRTTTLSGVTYHLYGAGSTWILEMGDLP